MWPGQQQQPGGEQNPQDPRQNPYQQQPGQPNPYQQQPQPGFGEQQPGYGYPQAGYQTPPPVQPWGNAPQQQPPPRPSGGSPFSTRTVAIVAASAVVVTAAATAAFVLTRDDEGANRADDKPAASSPAPVAPVSPAAPSGANPRAGGDVKPVIPGWKVVINPKHGTAFDVPPEWNVLGSGVIAGFEDAEKKDGSPLVTFSAPAYFKEDWCKVDSNKDGREESTSLAGTGTKGGQGAKDTAGAAHSEAGTWVFAGYSQKLPKEMVKISESKEYTTLSGLKGHVATATVSGVPKENKCSSDGKSIAFSFKNSKGDFASWVLYGAAGVPGEVDQATQDKILSSVRLSGD
ncbi:hypothetical protein EF912_05855 [Streptomyces sp. WAC07061]|uniref:hypothetical protein n=1 Tax=Streptomyces sp. WAC07061 TaxID=2487410 RepID=UPI000F793254|nr:hypothetical protein [Streptomyces sp. WAC07061]RSS62095.1 hypothetical protein EF912_05855 [Streptomyces sp. WAC07061]